MGTTQGCNPKFSPLAFIGLHLQLTDLHTLMYGEFRLEHKQNSKQIQLLPLIHSIVHNYLIAGNVYIVSIV